MTISFLYPQVLAGFFIFLRLMSLFFALPFFGDRIIPNQVRILIAFSLTVFFMHSLKELPTVSKDLGTLEFAILIIKEIFIGVALGTLAKIVFEALVMGASLVSYQMGFGTASLFMPGSSDQANAFTAFHRILVMLIFLVLHFHYIYIDAAFQSFEIIPLGTFKLNAAFIEKLIGDSALIFRVGLQMSAPILIALMLSMTALGLIARTVPQLNVFTVSFPVSFFVGLGTYLATFPFFPAFLRVYYEQNSAALLKMLYFMR